MMTLFSRSSGQLYLCSNKALSDPTKLIGLMIVKDE